MNRFYLLSLLCAVCLSSSACTSSSTSDQNQSASEQYLSDSEITAKVKGAILTDTTISGSARFVTVDTTNGVVTLSGEVPTKQDRDLIAQRAKSISGVKSVNNQLTIAK